MNYLTTAFVLVFCLLQGTSASDVLIQVSEGILRCETLTGVINDTSYTSCKGIPYALPPVGPLRFKAPVPVRFWHGIRDAKEHGPVCPQVDILSNTLLPGDENCLSLNVYSPNIKPTSLLPVIVLIHPGFFQSGSGNTDTLGPDFFVNANVVVVTINYRLGALGFLNLGIPEVPGNAGLKDQVLALKWIKSNIMRFGGDPNTITLKGIDAGAVSVGLHMVSPMSRGLFKRAVLMSGTPLNDWATEYASKERPYALAQSLGFWSRNPYEVLAFLQRVPPLHLLNSASVVFEEEKIQNLLQYTSFTPVVEDNFGQDRFLTESALESLAAGRLNVNDLLIGYTDEEAVTFINILEQYLPNYIQHKEMFVPNKIMHQHGARNSIDAADKIIDHYFGDKSISTENMRELISFVSNYTFVYDTYRFINRLPSSMNIYLYKFGLVSEWNHYSKLGEPYGITGNAHYDDYAYTSYASALHEAPVPNSEEYELIVLTTKLCTNFVKYGNPTPDSSLGIVWPSYDTVNKRYLAVYNSPYIGQAADEADVQFWKSIYDQYDAEF